MSTHKIDHSNGLSSKIATDKTPVYLVMYIIILSFVLYDWVEIKSKAFIEKNNFCHCGDVNFY